MASQHRGSDRATQPVEMGSILVPTKSVNGIKKQLSPSSPKLRRRHRKVISSEVVLQKISWSKIGLTNEEL